MSSLVLVVAGLMGAAGVVLAALGAHAAKGVGLDSAALMLMVHALAILAARALKAQSLLAPPVAKLAVWGWIAGAILFAGDIALRAFAGTRIFPLAAPTGGTLLILSWLALAIAAAFPRR